MKISIIGGTGTLGTELTNQLLFRPDVKEIIILSRNEHSQKKHFDKFKSEKLKYYIADIKDIKSLIPRLRNTDVCFHVAALKQVDTCELNPIECVNTNLIGTINVIRSITAKTKLVFSTSDKAVSPINSYGMSKAISENIIKQEVSKYKIFRWGNVVGSQGSVINIFNDKLSRNEEIPITDFDMTRFWINIKDAVKFMVFKTFENDENGLFVPYMKAAPIMCFIYALSKKHNLEEVKFHKTGIRPGEKLHELLEVNGKSSLNYDQYSQDEINQLIERCL